MNTVFVSFLLSFDLPNFILRVAIAKASYIINKSTSTSQNFTYSCNPKTQLQRKCDNFLVDRN